MAAFGDRFAALGPDDGDARGGFDDVVGGGFEFVDLDGAWRIRTGLPLHAPEVTVQAPTTPTTSRRGWLAHVLRR